MQRIFLLFLVLSIIVTCFACGGSTGIAGDTPTEAYKRLFSAVKSKNIEDIKKQLTKKTIDFGLSASQKNNTPLEKVYENGFTATTFSETLPTIRDERVNGDMGAVEVWNSKESKWEDLAFIKEDGAWKLAIGDVFASTYKSPGKGRDQREKEAANAIGSANSTPNAIANTHSVQMPASNVTAPTVSANKNSK